jgi:hypothetical protein
MVKKFAHLNYLVATIAEIQHFAKASNTPIVTINLMAQF